MKNGRLLSIALFIICTPYLGCSGPPMSERPAPFDVNTDADSNNPTHDADTSDIDAGSDASINSPAVDVSHDTKETNGPANICDAYCIQFGKNCNTEADFHECWLECEPYFKTSPPCFEDPGSCPQMGDSLECRLYHAFVAEADGDEHCQTAALDSQAGPCS